MPHERFLVGLEATNNHNAKKVTWRHDQLGNLAITSPAYSYYKYTNVLTNNNEGPSYSFQKTDETHHAQLLITTEGRKIIRRNPGVLRSIELYASIFDRTQADYGKNIMYTDSNISIKPIYSPGRFSSVHILETEDEKFAVKTPKGSIPVYYYNDMRQIQVIQKELGGQLLDLGVLLPTYLFASRNISCTKYEAGDSPAGYFTREFFIHVQNLAENFISKQKDPLWKGVFADAYDNGIIRYENFVLRDDGKLVWIDPVGTL